VSTSARELAEFDGLGQAELVRSGEITALELAEAALERIGLVDPLLGSVVWRMTDLDRQLARLHRDGASSPLAGVPTLLKDLGSHYAGEPERCGSRFTSEFVPDHDSELVIRMRQAGLVIVGKSSTSEFGNANETTLPGPTNNPWDLRRSTGGSSAGAGAAVAAGLVPLAHGSDGGGSIRWPAAWCGLFGLKPTRGRNTLGPDAAEGCVGLPVAHVLTRTVRDSAAALDALSGPIAGDPFVPPQGDGSFLEAAVRPPGGLRIGFSVDAPDGQPVDDACRQAVMVAARSCEALGHIVEEAAPSYDVESLVAEFENITFDGNAASADDWSDRLGHPANDEDIEPLSWFLIERGRRRSASQHVRSVGRLQRLARNAAAFFSTYDAFLTPANPTPPTRHEELTPTRGNVEEIWRRELGGGIFLLLANVTGFPAMSVPLHWSSDDLPVGAHFLGNFAREDVLFSLGTQLEQSVPWTDRRPPVWAGDRHQPVAGGGPGGRGR
jgi:amidase